MGTPLVVEISRPKPPKKLLRRLRRDRSQAVRHIVQWAFVALNLWLGVELFLWARYFELGGSGIFVERPAGAEGWLPIAGLMNFKYFISTGEVPAIHPAAMFLFIAFVLMSLLFKKAFCSWLCPVGTLSENLHKLGKKIFHRNLRLPRWADIALRGLKYLLLAFFVFVIGGMSTQVLLGFMNTPYGLIADVKMLNFFRGMGLTAAIVIGVLIVLSMLVQNFWCRYVCPYGALLGLASLLSPVKIRRDSETCIDCAKCAHVCPASLPVDKLVQIRSAECSACMICISACPAENALQFALPPRQTTVPAQRWYRRTLGPLTVTAALAYIFLGLVLWAHITNHWNTDVPREVYMHLVPKANSVSHPGI
ncbi:MAG TPA: 4Fe-4S binding protein [Terracidiphilus sp.]